MKVIYTAISDNYDTLKDPSIITPGWQYICYTNNKALKSNVWKIIYVDSLTVKEQRNIKIITPFEYDVCIWIDGSIKINCDLDNFLKKYHKDFFTLMKHPHRDCVYEEAVACMFKKKDKNCIIEKQVENYKQLQYPKHNGMVATGVIIRNNHPTIKEFCQRWWREVALGSCRDQLSFNFTIWNHPIQYNLIPFDILKNELILNKHTK